MTAVTSAVQVDEARGGDQIGNGLHRLAQYIVSNGKGVGKRDFLVRGVLEPVVGDDDQRVHLFLEFVDAFHGLIHSAAAFKGKGLSNDAHGKDSLFLSDLRHYRGSARAGTAPHAGGNEHHVGPLQQSGDLFLALLGGLPAHLGVRPRALAAGELLPDG